MKRLCPGAGVVAGMSLVLCVNDIHATRRPPSMCTATYWADLLDLLWQSVEVAKLRKAEAVAWAGDVLHHKAPGKTDHGLMMDLIRVARGYPCPLFVVPGNHDLANDRLDSIASTQPLGVLFESGAARRLENWAGDDAPLYGVPWQQEWSAERVADRLADWSPHGQSLVVTHAPVYPPEKEPRYPGAEVTPAKWWAEAMCGEGHVLYGHIHEPHGTYKVGGTTFCNNGALSRGSLEEHNLQRQVGVTLWDDETGEFEFVPLDAKPPEEVFRLRARDEKVTATRSLDEFLSGINGATLSVLNVEAVMSHIDESGVDPEVRDLAKEYLLGQQGGGDR
jgi:predicted phosphodiesterase